MLEEFLRRGADEMGLALDDGVISDISRFHDMLVKKNETLNLTRISPDPRESAFRNYLDSLSPLAIDSLIAKDASIMDAGSGAGLPGIPLALALKDAKVTMIDSVGKKVSFIREAIGELGLNAKVKHSRLEDAGRSNEHREKYDVCVSRALAPINVLCELTLPFVRVGGVLIAYKGPSAGEELDRAANALAVMGGRLERVIAAPSPGEEWEHRLVVIRKIAPTPKGYPRKAGEPSKKPL